MYTYIPTHKRESILVWRKYISAELIYYNENTFDQHNNIIEYMQMY